MGRSNRVAVALTAMVLTASLLANSATTPDGRSSVPATAQVAAPPLGSNVQFQGSTGNLSLQQPIVGMAPSADGQGYWLAARDGGIFAFGDARFFGSTANLAVRPSIVGIAATPDGGGYWLVSKDGGVFAFGDARFSGPTGSLHLSQPIVGIASTPDGRGYWLAERDGSVFAFGDARFLGPTGNMHLSHPIVGLAAAGDGHGYWLVASDGGIFAFGDAGFYGSTGRLTLRQPITGMAPTPDGRGYWLVAQDGGIFAIGDARFFGSAGTLNVKMPIVGMAAGAGGAGYWLVGADGGIFTFSASSNASGPQGPSSAPGPTGPAVPPGPTIPAVPPGPASSPSSAVDLPSLGVNVPAVRFPGAWWQTAFQDFHGIGSSWVRVDVNWASLEPTQGTYSTGILTQMDAVVASAASMGMSVLFIVAGTPQWDQPTDRTGALGGGENLPPVDAAGYASAMAYVAGRYASASVAWELWNEPNLDQFFYGADPASYVHLACSAYGAIKAAAPNTQVAAGALSGEGSAWLATAYADGLHGCFDMLSIHPYDRMSGTVPAGWVPPVNVAIDRQLMVANGDASKPIWFTEFGWIADPNPADPVPQGGVTLAEQATYTTQFIQEVASSYPYVKAVIVYNCVDSSNVNDQLAVVFAGLLDTQLNPKPVFYALGSLYGH